MPNENSTLSLFYLPSTTVLDQNGNPGKTGGVAGPLATSLHTPAEPGRLRPCYKELQELGLNPAKPITLEELKKALEKKATKPTIAPT